MEPNSIMEFVNSYGLLGILCVFFVALSLGAWRGAKWAGKKMLGDEGYVPRFVENAECMTEKITGGLHRQDECLTSLVETATSHTPLLTKIAAKQSDLFNQHVESMSRSHMGIDALGDMILEITPEEKMAVVKAMVNRLKTVLNAPASA